MCIRPLQISSPTPFRHLVDSTTTGNAIRWPDLDGAAQLHPLPARQTGRAGIETNALDRSEDAFDSRSLAGSSALDVTTGPLHPAAAPYSLPSQGGHIPNQYGDPGAQYYDDPAGGAYPPGAPDAYYDPYTGPVPESLTPAGGVGPEHQQQQYAAGGYGGGGPRATSPGPNAAYGGVYDAYGGGARSTSPGPQAAYGRTPSPGPQASYGVPGPRSTSPGPMNAYGVPARAGSPGPAAAYGGRQSPGPDNAYGGYR